MRVTLQQIADDVGLSVQTVSGVLGRRAESFSRETRRRVEASARRLGYRPNSSARAMRSGHFGAVGLLLSNRPHVSTLPAGLMDGVMASLDRLQLHLTVAQLPDAKLTSEGFTPRLLHELSVDGLLIDYTHEIPAAMLHLVQEHHVPSVWLNSRQRFDCVHPNDREAGHRLTRRLLDKGHTAIAYADFSGSTHYSARDRYAGYREAMQAVGLTPRRLGGSALVPMGERMTLATTLLERRDRPTAIVANGDTTCLPLLVAAAQRQVRVPDDLTLASFSGRPVISEWSAIEYLVVPEYEMGQAGVAMLMHKLAMPLKRQPAMAIPFEEFGRGGSGGVGAKAAAGVSVSRT